jgi:hypothetical protein
MTLDERLADIDKQFAQTKLKKDQLEGQLEDTSNELLRLQGSYRAIQALIDESKTGDPKAAK